MKFNFGKQKSKLGITIENKNKLNSLSIQRKSVDKSRMSFLSSMTDTGKEEETEQNKNERLLQTIITDYNIGKHLSLDAYCIENSNNDLNFLTSITSTNKRLDDFVFTSPKEEGEKCQLVEKTIVDTYKEENAHYKHSIEKLQRAISELKNSLFKTTGENNFVKQASDYQNRLKSDNAKQLIHINNMLIECKYLNKNLKEELTKKIIEKDSLFNALYNYTSKFNVDMADELKNLIQIYNNQYVKVVDKGDDEQYIENLFQQIKVLERKLASKNKEIKELERFLFVPDKEKKGKNKKNARTSVNAVNKNVK